MAFFKFRRSADPTSTQAPPPSVEDIRRRAKHRLIGATVLVLIGVVAFPLLVDKQPRPVAIDMPIVIADRQQVPPLALPSTTAPVQPQPVSVAPAAPVLPASVAAPVASSVEKPVSSAAGADIITEAAEPAPAGKMVVKNDKNQALAIDNKALNAPKIDSSSAAKAESGRALAALNGQAAKPLEKPHAAPADKAPVGQVPAAKPDDAAATQGRFVVQVGAFADAARARDVRAKLESAKLKTYTHVAETKDGKRIRVRVGPFDTKAEAEKTAAKVKKLNLQAAVLVL